MTKKIMRSLKIEEISAVDTPAQRGAVVAIMKREDVKKVSAMQAALTTSNENHTHLIDMTTYDGLPTRSGYTSFEMDHAHPFVVLEDGTIVIGESRGHKHEIETVGKNVTIDKEPEMTTPNADLEAAKLALIKSEEQNQALAGEIAELKILAGMTDEAKVHYAKLEGEVKTAFAKMDTEARKAAIVKANEVNAVIYTDLDGIEFRKNDDPRLIAMAKRSDEDRKARILAEEKVEKAALEAQTAEFDKLPGTAEEKAAVVKALNGIKSEDVRKKAFEILRAANKAMSGAFETRGVDRDPRVAKSDDVKTAEAELEALVKRHATEKKISEAKAYDQVLATSAGADLYKRMSA